LADAARGCKRSGARVIDGQPDRRYPKCATLTSRWPADITGGAMRSAALRGGRRACLGSARGRRCSAQMRAGPEGNRPSGSRSWARRALDSRIPTPRKVGPRRAWGNAGVPSGRSTMGVSDRRNYLKRERRPKVPACAISKPRSPFYPLCGIKTQRAGV